MGILSILFNKTFWAVAIVIIILIGVSVALVLSSPPAEEYLPSTPPAPSMTVTLNIQNNFGIKQIEIFNMYTRQTHISTIIDLPDSFNCTRGDLLRVTVVPQDGYMWNNWRFEPMSRICSANPAYIVVGENSFGDIIQNNQIVMVPETIMLEEAPPNEAITG